MKTALTIACMVACLCRAANGQLAELSPGEYWTPAESLPDQLAVAQQQIESHEGSRALKTLKKWIKNNPKSGLMDHALYLKVMALFDRQKYYHAFEAADELCKKHAASRFFEPSLHVQVEIARLYLAGAKRTILGFIRVTARSDAITILDRVIERWPGSELAARCLGMQGDYYAESERFIEAQGTYQLIVDHYPNSGYYYHGLLRAAETTHRQYRGPLYDSSSLDEAAVRYRRFMAEFPRRAEELDITQRVQLIRYQQAEKMFTIAEFYHRTNRIGAARYYWDGIGQRFGASDFASQARELLQQHR